MRVQFAEAMIQLAKRAPKTVFLSGDLGYMALEKVQESLGNRFINAGVAEQNMISVAAGLAAMQWVPWVYSIAPFVTLRPYEQIRNDICLHKLPVKLVGNGGGYGYGIMGATHHVLQDVGVMRMLPHMQVFLPTFPDDVGEAIEMMQASSGPAYLRLNLAVEGFKRTARFAMWRRLTEGRSAVVLSMGPIIGGLLERADSQWPGELDIWSVGILPFEEMPDSLLASIRQKRKVLVIEEHLAAGGLGELSASFLLQHLPQSIQFKSVHAKGYLSNRYGSQRWHQTESGLAGSELEQTVTQFLHASTPN